MGIFFIYLTGQSDKSGTLEKGHANMTRFIVLAAIHCFFVIVLLNYLLTMRLVDRPKMFLFVAFAIAMNLVSAIVYFVILYYLF